MVMIRRRPTRGGKSRYQWRLPKSLGGATGTCPTRKCAQECARSAEERIRAGLPEHRHTLAELLDLYAERYLPEVPDSAPLYRRHLAYWKKRLGEVAAEALTPPMIGEAKVELAARKSRFGRPLSAATVNRYLTTLSSVYAWAAKPEVGLVVDNPVRRVSRLEEPADRVRYLSRPEDEQEDAELVRLLRACERSSNRLLLDLVLVLLFTGCRVNEVLGIKRSEVRLGDKCFVLPPERSKTEEPAVIHLAGAALEVVERRYRVVRLGNEHLFPGKGRNPGRFPWRGWRKALEEAGIADFRPHDLRHTAASYMAMQGLSLAEIQAALRHKTLQATQRYLHLSSSHRATVAQQHAESLDRYVRRPS